MTNSKTVKTVKTTNENNLVKSWISNARNAEYNFIKTAVYAFEQFDNRNNIPLLAMIAFCNGKEFGSYKIEKGYTLTQFKTPLKRIMDQVLSDVTIRYKDKKAKVKVGENGGVNHDQLQGLRILAASQVGIKSKSFDEAFPKPEKKVSEYTVEKADAEIAKLLTKISTELGMTIDQAKAKVSAIKVAA